MIGILNEKPSQARNFAKALGGMTGTFNGEKYIIVASRGHLYGFDDSPANNVKESKKEKYASWKMENLPWDENDFIWKYKEKEGAHEVLSEIKRKLSGCDEIVIATDDDPSGEGELLAWEIILMLNLKVSKYSRMFFSDESEKEIQKAFINRRFLGNDIKCVYDDPDYRQALFRTKWDYLSMQWTRISAACSPKGQFPRQGRLKSAMVKIVGDQLKEIENYVKKPFFQLRFKDEFGHVFISENFGKFENKEEVSTEKFTKSEIILDDKIKKYTSPPKFLDLATLGGLLASKGISAKNLLSIYQEMYNAKIVSYPRTEDKKITEEQFKELLPLADKIAKIVGIDPEILQVKTPRKSHVGTGMAHGANRPGSVVPQSLEQLDKDFGEGASIIYKTLALNYLATLCKNYEYEQQFAHLEKYPDFKGSINIPISKGWKQIYNEEEEEENIDPFGKTAVPFVFEGANEKPSAPTMKWLMKRLEKRNVGTGATRTSIYADITNEKSKFPLLIENRGKISMPPNGQTSYILLADTHIGNLEITERVIDQMREVYKGETDGKEYLHDIQKMVREDILIMEKNKKNIKFEETNKEGIGTCPVCGGMIVENKTVFGCENWKKGCHFVISKEIFSKKISKSTAKQLLEKGITSKLDGFISKKTGRKFSARLKLDPDNKIVFDFEEKEEDFLCTCPVCKIGKIKEVPVGYKCTNSFGGCKTIIWKNALNSRGKEKISKSEARKMFEGGKVKVKLKRKSDGKVYEAYVFYNSESNKIELTFQK